MSYPGVEPADVQTLEPVGTQVPSAGVPTPNPLLANASQEMHEEALRNDNFVHVNPTELKSVVQQAVTDMFALKPNWMPKPKAEKQIQFVITCPSGQNVLAKHLTTMDLLEADLIEDLDFFTKKLFPQNVDPAGNPIDEDESASTIWTVLKDIDKRKKFIELLNKLLVISIQKPKIVDDGLEIATGEDGKQFLISGAEMAPEDFTKVFGRKLPELGENETYCSAVDFADKMSIFAELNKPLSVIEPFRQESLVSLASMESSEDVRN